MVLGDLGRWWVIKLDRRAILDSVCQYHTVCLKLSWSVWLSVGLSFYLSVCLPSCLSLYLAICLPLWIHEFCFHMRFSFVCQCLTLSVAIYHYIFDCLLVCSSFCLSCYLSVFLSVGLTFCLSVWIHEFCCLTRFAFVCQCHTVWINLSLSVWLSVFLFVYFSCCLSICLCVCLNSWILRKEKSKLSLVAKFGRFPYLRFNVVENRGTFFT